MRPLKIIFLLIIFGVSSNTLTNNQLKSFINNHELGLLIKSFGITYAIKNIPEYAHYHFDFQFRDDKENEKNLFGVIALLLNFYIFLKHKSPPSYGIFTKACLTSLGITIGALLPTIETKLPCFSSNCDNCNYSEI